MTFTVEIIRVNIDLDAKVIPILSLKIVCCHGGKGMEGSNDIPE